MKEKSKSEVSIIGGADGPTSIFIAGRTRKKPLKVRIRNIIYRYRRKIVEKKVVADSHTLDELVQYARRRSTAGNSLRSMRPTLNCTGLHKRKCALCWAGRSSLKWMC